ncbi:hypothetical protein EON79_00825 [bacterium]|nr:MAG: hypothetical protein EON79_00825 [bacterium]
MRNRQAGRVNFLAIGAVACILLIVAVFALGKQSPTEVGVQFMSALAKGDAATLTDLTYMGDTPKEEVRKQWDFATQEASKYYTFIWKVSGFSQPIETEASIKLQVNRNAEAGGYEENFQLPLIKKDGKWLVDVRAISRDMYPALPR